MPAYNECGSIADVIRELRADLVVANRYEAEVVGDQPLLAVTLGEEGALLLESGKEVARARPPSVVAVDGTAAGDAFTGCLVVSLLEGRDREESLRRACAAGAIAAPWVVSLLLALVRPPLDKSWRAYYAAVGRDAATSIQQVALAIVFLPHQAWVSADAIVRTLWRMGVSRNHLLQWRTASQTERAMESSA